ncbi:MAG: PIN domain-containing protein [Bacteroidota bacterium]
MTKLYIDTNVFVDVFLERKEFVYASGNIIEMCAERAVTGFTSASSILNLYFIVRKFKGGATAKKILSQILSMFEITEVDEKIIYEALESNFTDVEDAVQYQCALRADADFIITRNLSDFKKSRIPVYSPEQFLTKIKK